MQAATHEEKERMVTSIVDRIRQNDPSLSAVRIKHIPPSDWNDRNQFPREFITPQEITNEDVVAILDALQSNTRVQWLCLDWVTFGSSACVALSQLLQITSCTIKCLEIVLNMTKDVEDAPILGASEIQCLFQGLKSNHSIVYLRFSLFDQINRQPTVLTELLEQNKTLAKFSLQLSSVKDPVVLALAKGLETNRTLISLDLTDNAVSATGLSALASVLATVNDTLKELILKHNEMGDEGMKALIECLKVNIGLEKVNAAYNKVSPELTRQMKKMLTKGAVRKRREEEEKRVRAGGSTRPMTVRQVLQSRKQNESQLQRVLDAMINEINRGIAQTEKAKSKEKNEDAEEVEVGRASSPLENTTTNFTATATHVATHSDLPMHVVTGTMSPKQRSRVRKQKKQQQGSRQPPNGQASTNPTVIHSPIATQRVRARDVSKLTVATQPSSSPLSSASPIRSTASSPLFEIFPKPVTFPLTSSMPSMPFSVPLPVRNQQPTLSPTSAKRKRADSGTTPSTSPSPSQFGINVCSSNASQIGVGGGRPPLLPSTPFQPNFALPYYHPLPIAPSPVVTSTRQSSAQKMQRRSVRAKKEEKPVQEFTARPPHEDLFTSTFGRGVEDEEAFAGDLMSGLGLDHNFSGYMDFELPVVPFEDLRFDGGLDS